MRVSLKLKNEVANKLEVGITFFLLLYYLGINLPPIATQAWALLVFLIVPFLIIAHVKRYTWLVMRNIALLLVTICTTASVFWSSSPEATLSYSRAFLCSTAFGIYLATRYTLNEQIRLLLWLLGVFTLLNFLVPLVLPSYGISDSGWRGITRHKNELSGFMATSAILFLSMFVYVRRYRWLTLTVFLMALLLLILSQGKGSLGIFFGLLPILPVYKLAKQEYKLRAFLSICAVIIAGVFITSTLANLEFIVVDFLGKDMGFNGRDQLWTYLIDRGLERPLLGYGYAGFWNNRAESLGVALNFSWIQGVGDGGGNAHSSYVEVFLHLGLLGILLISISCLIFLFKVVMLLGLTRRIEYFWLLQFLLLLMITSYYESYGGFLAYRHLFWVLYVSYSYSISVHLRRIFQSGHKLANLKNQEYFLMKN